jgi:hypothetical protein
MRTGGARLGGSLGAKSTRVAELETQLAESLSTQNMEVGFHVLYLHASMQCVQHRWILILWLTICTATLDQFAGLQ